MERGFCRSYSASAALFSFCYADEIDEKFQLITILAIGSVSRLTLGIQAT
jgi:hypothetical protein